LPAASPSSATICRVNAGSPPSPRTCAPPSRPNTARALAALPVNDTEEGYDYPDRVRWSLAQDNLASYDEAAEFLNFNNIDMVCLQHEYGIFGGPAGSHILRCCAAQDALVTTLHTVLREPNPDQLSVMEQIATLSTADCDEPALLAVPAGDL